METLNSLFISSLISLVVLTSCSKMGAESKEERKDIPLTKTQQTLVVSSNAFALNLYKSLSSLPSESDKNIFISPLSASLALSALSVGASGETLNEMKTALGFSAVNMEEMNLFYKTLVPALKEVDKKCDVKIANALWLRNGFTPLKSFTTTLAENYYADVKTLDFNSPTAVSTINKWCSDNTKGLIDKIIDKIEPNMMFYYTNALYFKGKWASPFKVLDSNKGDFTNIDGSKSRITFMAQSSSYFYKGLEGVSVLSIPYGNEAYSMVIVLPDKGVSVKDVVSELTPEKWDEYTKEMISQRLYLKMPKFEVKYEAENTMIQALKNIGVKSAFDAISADFSGITGGKDIFLTLFKQKTYIKTDEEGTEAAAVTIGGGMCTSPGPADEFIIDRPFIYAIQEKSTGTLLFLGSYLSAK